MPTVLLECNELSDPYILEQYEEAIRLSAIHATYITSRQILDHSQYCRILPVSLSTKSRQKEKLFFNLCIQRILQTIFTAFPNFQSLEEKLWRFLLWSADQLFPRELFCRGIMKMIAWHRVLFQSSCTIDVTYFPFDQQTCIMKFGSWTFTGDQVSLSLFNNKNHVDLSDYWKSGTWDIIEVPAYLNVHNTTGIQHSRW